MERCVNDPFSYCSAPNNKVANSEPKTFRDMGNRDHTITLPFVSCPYDRYDCPHRLSQAELDQRIRAAKSQQFNIAR